jgi:hypothetical protein
LKSLNAFALGFGIQFFQLLLVGMRYPCIQEAYQVKVYFSHEVYASHGCANFGKIGVNPISKPGASECMLIHSLSVSYFRRFHHPLKMPLHPDLTILDGEAQLGKKSLLQALAICARHSPFTSRDFCLAEGKPHKPCHLGLEMRQFEEHLPADHLPGIDWREDYLLNEHGHLETVSQFRNGHTLHEVRCLRSRHPNHPELHDLMQLNNAQLRRRLTLSAVPTREVDRRSNRAIRQALRLQYADDLELRQTLLPLHGGDALHLQRAIDKALPHCVFRRVTNTSRDPAFVFKEAEREFQRRRNDDATVPGRRRLLLLALPPRDGLQKLLHKSAFCRELRDWITCEDCQIVLVAPHEAFHEHFEPSHLCRLEADGDGRCSVLFEQS